MFIRQLDVWTIKANRARNTEKMFEITESTRQEQAKKLKMKKKYKKLSEENFLFRLRGRPSNISAL